MVDAVGGPNSPATSTDLMAPCRIGEVVWLFFQGHSLQFLPCLQSSCPHENSIWLGYQPCWLFLLSKITRRISLGSGQSCRPPHFNAYIFEWHYLSIVNSEWINHDPFKWETAPIVISRIEHDRVEVGTRLARAGYAVFGIDYEGHGRSMGARCYIKKFEYIINDCHDFFKSICGTLMSTSSFLEHEKLWLIRSFTAFDQSW